MITLIKNRTLPIGLHLDARSATLIQLIEGSAGHEVYKMAQSEIPFDEDVPVERQDEETAKALSKLISDHHFKGRQVVDCLGSQELFVQNVRLPQLPQEEVEKVVRWEAEERLPYPVSDAEIRHLSAGEVRQDSNIKQEVILLACRLELVQRRIRILEQAGLIPLAIEVEPCAILRCFEAQDLEKSGETRRAYLNLGERAATVIFAEGDRILFLKYIAGGGRKLDESVSQCLGLNLQEAAKMRSTVTASSQLDSDDEIHRSVIGAIREPLETMASEIELCLRYYKVTFRGKGLEKIVVTGCEASSWLVEYLSERLGTPCEFGNPLIGLEDVPDSHSIRECPGKWTTAVGLSLKHPLRSQ